MSDEITPIDLREVADECTHDPVIRNHLRGAADIIEALRAANARLQAWHDVVVAARVVDAVDIGTAAMVLRQANGRILELQDAVDEIERRSVKAIIRPQPLAKE